MSKPSIAEDFFRRIQGFTNQQDAVSFLRDLVAVSKTEESWLDFKSGEIANQNDNERRAFWGKALSAFANTDGGVIVFGIDARTNSDGVDAAHAVTLVPRPDALKTDLDRLMKGATDPPVQGVAILAFPDSNVGRQGFVVAYIPESSFKPHRAVFASNNFYLRTGTHSNPVTTGTLRYLFYPQARSMVVPVVACRAVEAQFTKGYFAANFGIVLENRGTKTLRDLFVVIMGDFKSLSHDSQQWIPIQGYSGLALECQRPIHPGSKIALASTSLSGIQLDPIGDGFTICKGPMTVDFDFRIYANDQEPIVCKVHFSREDIESQATLRGGIE